MKTLVTGATGFIGKHLVPALLKEGKTVKCLVRLKSNTKNLETLGIELCYGDLLDKSSLEKAIEEVDVIYHLAAEVYSSKINEYYKKNVIGTKNLIDICENKNIKKFIYLSSIAAVGPNQRKDILLDEQSPCYPSTPYGKSKLEAERILLKAIDSQNLPIVIIRAPIIYGPGQPNVLTRFFTEINKGKFKMIGGGNNLKSFCYIDNLIDGLILAEKIKNSTGKIYFISDSKVYTPNELAQIIAMEEGVTLKKQFLPSSIASFCGILLFLLEKIFKRYSIDLYSIKTLTLDFGCSIKKAELELGYRPKIDIREGIRRTIEWCRKEDLLN